ncbi:signal transduction histidine kinase [Thermobacillus composti KWC4]|uniref:histidine kinase n=1 Tax=Thermobacillus composti (strain DSM 18247 / JCM 13945 / KWC4) TaxID=717605 RepID=L0EBA7_THECK|nr:HAMP domain-containing sensor histidine kinase [Thermobacillus composti]AGA57092.1 signal transduction histidine kinase [Thermobacillus composti KWC4]
MLRNREIQYFLTALCAIALVMTFAAAFVSLAAALITAATAILLIFCFFWFTRWRYRELEKLSGYLRRISGGDYTLDVRDNREGELSILKNEIYKVTLKLSEQGSQLQRDKLRLTDAISDISHQLKTPLTSMMVMVDLLDDSGLPAEKRKEFTNNIRVQLERLDWLISSLLKLSKIDAGTARFKREPVKAETLVRKALESVLIPMDIKEQKLTVQGDPEAAFTGDLHWTAEALINILKNCVEHTPEGGTIAVTYGENALYTEIVVADSGTGIPKEDLPHIFKRFYRGKNASEGSIGIGLAMAHSIVTSQYGTIEVKSSPGQGTEFRIKFYKGIV